MFSLGILPIEDPTLDMRVPLRQVTPEEARVIKRKFRKVWRKCMKEKLGTSKMPVSSKKVKASAGITHVEAERNARTAMVTNKLGLGKHVPSRQERLERKRLVYEHLWEKEIVPKLIRFENPERSKPKSDE